MYIENPDLCSSVAVRKETLDRKDKAGLIVRQLRLNLHTIAWEKNSVCKFKVEAETHGSRFAFFGVMSHETGVLAVIQVNKQQIDSILKMAKNNFLFRIWFFVEMKRRTNALIMCSFG